MLNIKNNLKLQLQREQFIRSVNVPNNKFQTQMFGNKIHLEVNKE